MMYRIPFALFQNSRSLIQESASKLWVTYAENERKSSYLQAEKLQNQIQSVSCD